MGEAGDSPGYMLEVHIIMVRQRPSLNAVGQALRRYEVDGKRLTRERYFAILGVPRLRESSARHWEESYNIRPWESRTDDERHQAELVVHMTMSRIAGGEDVTAREVEAELAAFDWLIPMRFVDLAERINA